MNRRGVFLFFGVVVCVFLLSVYIFDFSYLFHGIRCTYLRGESSGQIDDYSFFYTRAVKSSNHIPIPLSNNYKTNTINDSLENRLKKTKSVSFLVIKNDSIQFEKYYGIGGENSLTNSFSMAKSITSLLVGCAIRDGYIKSVDQSISDFIPEVDFFNGEVVKIKHLLNMSSGMDWLENYKRPISVTAKAYYGTNIKNLILGRRFIDSPGVIYKYQSGNTQLLGVVLERAIGESVSSYAGRVLWSKIGAKNDALWTLDYNGGVEKMFCCFNSNARDFAKIGLLMLNGGVVGGDTVVPKKYIDWLTSLPKLINGETSSFDSKKMVNHYSNSWWVARVLEKDIIYARGFLGQYIVIIPELNLVFVRLGMKENEKGDENDYMLTKNLKFFIEQVIRGYS